MPRGPQGQKRAADAGGCVITMAKIATGDITKELWSVSGKVLSGKAGAKARLEKTAKEERMITAKKAAARRWWVA